jgi:hypothetical protein
MDALNWSAQQGDILTGGGRLEQLYNAPNFIWTGDELPHYHKMRGDTHEVFMKLKTEGKTSTLVVGAWSRPLFVGGWQHTGDHTETVFNVQTPSLFIDLRIPLLPGTDLAKKGSISQLSDDELRLLARRHCFAGYSLLNAGPWSVENPPVCVRHHCIDWNFTGKMRPRPNKWRIEMHQQGKVWKEFGWAKDEYGQHVYMERWQRLPNASGPFLALRKAKKHQRDGVLVVVGQHFNFCEDRITKMPCDPDHVNYPGLQALVDDMIAKGKRQTAIDYLSLQGCHGLVSSAGGAAPWTIDAALHPWLVGSQLIQPEDIQVDSSGRKVMWKGEEWDVVEDSFGKEGMKALFSGSFPRRCAL